MCVAVYVAVCVAVYKDSSNDRLQCVMQCVMHCMLQCVMHCMLLCVLQCMLQGVWQCMYGDSSNNRWQCVLCVAVCYHVLQHVAACCSASQRVALCCSVLQHIAVCGSVLQFVPVCGSVLQCVAVCCSVMQCVAVCRNVLQCIASVITHCQNTSVLTSAKLIQQQVCGSRTRVSPRFSKVSPIPNLRHQMTIELTFENHCRWRIKTHCTYTSFGTIRIIFDTLYLYYIKTHRTNMSLLTHCAQRIHTHLPIYLVGAFESYETECVDALSIGTVCMYIVYGNSVPILYYGVATVSRIDKIIGLFCKRDL